MITDEAGRVLAAESDNEVYVRPTGPWDENQLAPQPRTETGAICAWCPDYNPTHPANKNASHGMCNACLVKMMRELDAKEAKR